ncbi:MAG: GAF domain-containing protein [Hellea sp.]|nr:GAF domain-containing protein [Hellea sp.]
MQKPEQYQTVLKEVTSVIDGEPSMIARFASVVCLLNQAFDDFFWTGFYLVDPVKKNELVVGPYQGTLGCLRIPFGKGVCGSCAALGEIQIVEDVHAFPGHIACDSRSKSEIVVPVRDGQGNLVAVLDVDSADYGSFDQIDAQYLEELCSNIMNGVTQT